MDDSADAAVQLSRAEARIAQLEGQLGDAATTLTECRRSVSEIHHKWMLAVGKLSPVERKVYIRLVESITGHAPSDETDSDEAPAARGGEVSPPARSTADTDRSETVNASQRKPSGKQREGGAGHRAIARKRGSSRDKRGR